ncbi:MAG: efflux RND transporter periplasmic adaptor subunit [Cyclobacteriaceae bacterium]
MNTLRYNFFILFSFILLSCGKPEATETTETEDEAVSGAATITLNEEQAQIISINTTRPEMRIISDVVKVTGMMDVPPQNLVTIAAPLGGFVSETKLLQGNRVKKGDIILKLKHPEYIRIQQDYLETTSQLTMTEQEWKRQEALSKENINAQKTLQAARNDFEKTKARHQALTATLKLIGIESAEILKTGIREDIPIFAPITGYVAQVNINIGMYAAPDQVMLKIIDTDHLHAELQVFEKDILKIKAGQKIRFFLSGETKERTARVYLTGKEISEDRTVRVHGHLDKPDGTLLPGMFLSAVIETGTNEARALPESCFISFEGGDYVFVETAKQTYTMAGVSKGSCDSGFCTFAFIGDAVEGPVVMEGANTLLGLLKNKPEEE